MGDRELTAPETPLTDYFGRGLLNRAGRRLPALAGVPMYVDLILQGRLPLDKFVTDAQHPRPGRVRLDEMHHRSRAGRPGWKIRLATSATARQLIMVSK